MKKICLSFVLLISCNNFAQDQPAAQQDAQEEYVMAEEDAQESKDNTAAQESELEQVEKSDDQYDDIDRTLIGLDDDDFFGDSLDKMLEMGALNEEVEIKAMPMWKVWLLRIGSSILAKVEACKRFMVNRCDDAKYLAIVAWAKATGKKLPRRIIKKKKKSKKHRRQKMKHETSA